jgi:hypothetical protein
MRLQVPTSRLTWLFRTSFATYGSFLSTSSSAAGSVDSRASTVYGAANRPPAGSYGGISSLRVPKVPDERIRPGTDPSTEVHRWTRCRSPEATWTTAT